MRLDPRTKLLILAVTSVSVFMNKSIAVECVLAGIPLVLLSISGNLKRMLKYAAFFLTLLLIQLFIVPRLPVTFGGIVYMFAVYIRKLLPCFMLGSFLIATTSVSKFLAAITKLRLSKGLTIALAVTLRYFPTMREEWASIRDAMALRGISASAAGLISHPVQTMEHVYVPLLVSASRISDEITQAAITRGIEHTGERSCIEEIAFSFADLLVVMAYVLWIRGKGGIASNQLKRTPGKLLRHCWSLRLRKNHAGRSDRPLLGCEGRTDHARRPGCAGIYQRQPSQEFRHRISECVSL